MKQILCKILGHKWLPRDWKTEPLSANEVGAHISHLWMAKCGRCGRRQ